MSSTSTITARSETQPVTLKTLVARSYQPPTQTQPSLKLFRAIQPFLCIGALAAIVKLSAMPQNSASPSSYTNPQITQIKASASPIKSGWWYYQAQLETQAFLPHPSTLRSMARFSLGKGYGYQFPLKGGVFFDTYLIPGSTHKGLPVIFQGGMRAEWRVREAVFAFHGNCIGTKTTMNRLSNKSEFLAIKPSYLLQVTLFPTQYFFSLHGKLSCLRLKGLQLHFYAKLEPTNHGLLKKYYGFRAKAQGRGGLGRFQETMQVYFRQSKAGRPMVRSRSEPSVPSLIPGACQSLQTQALQNTPQSSHSESMQAQGSLLLLTPYQRSEISTPTDAARYVDQTAPPEAPSWNPCCARHPSRSGSRAACGAVQPDRKPAGHPKALRAVKTEAYTQASPCNAPIRPRKGDTPNEPSLSYSHPGFAPEGICLLTHGHYQDRWSTTRFFLDLLLNHPTTLWECQTHSQIGRYKYTQHEQPQTWQSTDKPGRRILGKSTEKSHTIPPWYTTESTQLPILPPRPLLRQKPLRKDSRSFERKASLSKPWPARSAKLSWETVKQALPSLSTPKSPSAPQPLPQPQWRGQQPFYGTVATTARYATCPYRGSPGGPADPQSISQYMPTLNRRRSSLSSTATEWIEIDPNRQEPLPRPIAPTLPSPACCLLPLAPLVSALSSDTDTPAMGASGPADTFYGIAPKPPQRSQKGREFFLPEERLRRICAPRHGIPRESCTQNADANATSMDDFSRPYQTDARADSRCLEGNYHNSCRKKKRYTQSNQAVYIATTPRGCLLIHEGNEALTPPSVIPQPWTALRRESLIPLTPGAPRGETNRSERDGGASQENIVKKKPSEGFLLSRDPSSQCVRRKQATAIPCGARGDENQRQRGGGQRRQQDAYYAKRYQDGSRRSSHWEVPEDQSHTSPMTGHYRLQRMYTLRSGDRNRPYPDPLGLRSHHRQGRQHGIVNFEGEFMPKRPIDRPFFHRFSPRPDYDPNAEPEVDAGSRLSSTQPESPNFQKFHYLRRFDNLNADQAVQTPQMRRTQPRLFYSGVSAQGRTATCQPSASLKQLPACAQMSPFEKYILLCSEGPLL